MGTDIHGRLQLKYGDTYHDAGPIDDDRNYQVFAMLAGIRNGFGFAGVETHKPLAPISEPRGLPEKIGVMGNAWDRNSSKFVDIPYSDDDVGDDTFFGGDHSFSWLYLSEILAWDGWDKPLARTGILDKEEFERMEREGGTPKAWCGGVSGRDVIIVSAEEARAGVAHTHVRYNWNEPFRDAVKQFATWVDYLRMKYAWRMEQDPSAVRLVFGFDS